MITHGQLAAMSPADQRAYWRALLKSWEHNAVLERDRGYQADATEARRNDDWSRA